MTFRRRCFGVLERLEAWGWWPDVACASVAFVGMTLLVVFDREAASGTGLGEVLPGALSTLWAVLIAVSALVAGVSVLARKWAIASWATMTLAILLMLNCSVTVGTNGWGAVPAAIGYSIAVILLSERVRVLDSRRYAIPLPVPWRGHR